MGRRTSQPRELVRLSPLQFSFSVSVIVILVGGAALGGYYYGMKKSAERQLGAAGTDSSTAGVETAGTEPERSDTRASVTFYSTLTRPREDAGSQPPPADTASGMSRKKTPAASPPAKPELREPPTATGSLVLQVASYKDRSKARMLLDELVSDGYAGTVTRADLGERGVWYRVRIGPYGTEKDAKSALDALGRDRKLKGFITR